MQTSEDTRHIVIFGDIYSSPSPTQAKWPDFFKFEDEYPPPVVHNFAMADLTIASMYQQLLQFFAKFLGNPNESPSLPPDKTLYVFFLGTHKIQFHRESGPSITKFIIDAASWMHMRANAQLFLFIDIPPVHQSPGNQHHDSLLQVKIEEYNQHLQKEIGQFYKTMEQWDKEDHHSLHEGFYHSSHFLISDILNKPEEYDFDEERIRDEGVIWNQGRYFSSAIHKIMAEAIISQMDESNALWYKTRPRDKETDGNSSDSSEDAGNS
jgi:hypothetical protein